MNEQGVLNLIVALARLLEIDPLTLSIQFLQYEKNQEYYNGLLLLAGEHSED